jgi:hypothetical protein
MGKYGMRKGGSKGREIGRRKMGVEVRRGGLRSFVFCLWMLVVEIEEGFFPQKARKGRRSSLRGDIRRSGLGAPEEGVVQVVLV